MNHNEHETTRTLHLIEAELARLIHGADPVLMQGLIDWSHLAARGEW